MLWDIRWLCISLCWYSLLNKSRLLNISSLSLWVALSCSYNNWLSNWLLDNRLLNSWGSSSYWFLNWLIVNILFNSLLWDIINFSFLSDVWNIFGNVFNLLIVSVSFLDWNITGISNGLIFSYSSSNRDIFNSLLSNLFCILSFIRNLDVVNSWFIVGIGLLNWNVFNIRLGLWFWLFENLSLNWLLDNWLNIWLLNYWGLLDIGLLWYIWVLNKSLLNWLSDKSWWIHFIIFTWLISFFYLYLNDFSRINF